jgi:hypothetical protein
VFPCARVELYKRGAVKRDPQAHIVCAVVKRPQATSQGYKPPKKWVIISVRYKGGFMSEFFKDYKSCKNFEFKVSTKKDIERILRYFQAKDYTPLPKELLVEAK